MKIWEDYSFYDLVNLESEDENKKYIAKALLTFKTLAKIYQAKIESDQEAMSEHKLVLEYLDQLNHTFELLRIKYLFNSESLKIDMSDSGFMNFVEINALDVEAQNLKNSFILDSEQTSLKEQMITHMFTHESESPELLEKMGKSRFRQLLGQKKHFSFFNEGKLTLKSEDDKYRRYFYHWACFDKRSNMPYIYLLEFDHDLAYPALHEDKDHFERFLTIIKSEGSRAPAAGIVAMAIDQRLEDVHPQILKRICIGPMYSAAFSVGLDEEQTRIFEQGDQDQKFVFHITEQFVFAQGHSIIQNSKMINGILESEKIRQSFYLPKPKNITEYSDFNELEAQKASLIRKSVIMPYKLHQHSGNYYKNHKIISFTPEGEINGI